MSEKELQSLMQRAHRSLKSARNLLDDGGGISRPAHCFTRYPETATLSEGLK